MTRQTSHKPGTEKRRIISYEPSEENLQFLEARKEVGVPYNFTLEKAMSAHRANNPQKRKAA